MSGSIIPSSVTINNPGSGYGAGDQPFINQGGDETATLFVVTTDGGGGVLTFLCGYGSSSTGCGYVPAIGVPTDGGSGTGLTVDIGAVGPSNDATHAGIATFTITNGGSGYAINDTGYFDQGGNHSATYSVLSITAGAVSSINLVLGIQPAGSGYTVSAGVAAVNDGPQPGSGSGLTISIDSIGQCSFASSGYFNDLRDDW